MRSDLKSLFNLGFERFGFTRQQILSRNRRAQLVDVRHFLMWLARSNGMHYKAIGHAFKRTPSNAMHAVRKINDWRGIYPDIDRKCRILSTHTQKNGTK